MDGYRDIRDLSSGGYDMLRKLLLLLAYIANDLSISRIKIISLFRRYSAQRTASG